jgi:tetratricopeptide (TPR) repeat protein
MQAGAQFDKQKKYEEAVKAYQQALKLVPNDVRATAALRNSQFNLNLVNGRKALAAKRFPDAAKEFEAALKLLPGDPEATTLLKKAREGKP